MDDDSTRDLSRTFFEEELGRHDDVVPSTGQEVKHLERLLGALVNREEFCLLDIGCGIGFVAHAVQRLFPQSRACGTDISPLVVGKAEELTHDNVIEFHVASEVDLPFEDGYFDYAVCRFSIHHYPDMIAHFREVNRVLARDGTYLVIDVVPEEGQQDACLNEAFVEVERDTTGHVKFYTLSEYRRLSQQSGFAVESIERFPLLLDLRRRDYAEKFRSLPDAFQQSISASYYEGGVSFVLPAAGVFARKTQCRRAPAACP